LRQRLLFAASKDTVADIGDMSVCRRLVPHVPNVDHVP